jgi:hypothetical protein
VFPSGALEPTKATDLKFTPSIDRCSSNPLLFNSDAVAQFRILALPLFSPEKCVRLTGNKAVPVAETLKVSLLKSR